MSNLEFPKSQLQAAFKKLRGATGKNPNHLILEHVCVDVVGGSASLYASDTEIQMCIRNIPVQGPDCRFTVPAAKMASILDASKQDETVKVRLNGTEEVQLNISKSRYKLHGQDPGLFPFMEENDYRVNLTLPEGQIKSLVGESLYAMAHQDVRYYLNGMLFEITDNTLRAVSTDGHRLAIGERPCQTGVSGVEQFILPRKCASEIEKALGHNEDDATLQFSAKALQLTNGNLVVTCKLIDGKFPDYNGILEGVKSYTRAITLDRTEFMGALQRGIILGHAKYPGMRIAFQEDSLGIEFINEEQEKAEDAVPAVFSQAFDGELGMNGRYLLDALSTLNSNKVVMGVSDNPHQPASLFGEADDATHIVMPMNLR